jgi:branched-chain amino acid transport system substrate-binding protein
MRRGTTILSTLLLVSVLLAGCVTTQPEPVIEEKIVTEEVIVTKEVEVEKVVTPTPGEYSEIKVGAVLPLTGDVGQIGVEAKAASELAMEIINNSHPELGGFPFAATEGIPNLGGARYTVIFGDHQGKPEIAVTETERLITEEEVVAFGTGNWYSGCTLASRVVTERYKIPMLNDVSSSPRLPILRAEEGLEWWFSITFDDGDNAYLYFDLIKDLNEKKGYDIKTVALIHDNAELGMAAAEANTQVANEYGIEIVEDVAYEVGTEELVGEVTRLKQAEPDVVIFNHSGSGGPCIAYFRASKDLNFNPGVFQIGQGCSHGSVLDALGPDGDYFLAREVFTLDLAESTGRDFIVTINDMYRRFSGGHDFNANTARSFQSHITLAAAINNAGSTDPEAIRQALIELEVPAEDLIIGWEGIKFDPETGKNVYAETVAVQVLDSKWRLVYPFEIAAVEFVPWPNWDER